LPPQLLEVKIPDGPGSVKFWPKDSSVTFGTDPNPGNYVAVIAQEARTSSAGLAVVDMADVVAAFKALGTAQAGLFSGQVCKVLPCPSTRLDMDIWRPAAFGVALHLPHSFRPSSIPSFSLSPRVLSGPTNNNNNRSPTSPSAPATRTAPWNAGTTTS